MTNQQNKDNLEPIKIDGQIDQVDEGSLTLPDSELIDRIDQDRKRLYPAMFKKIVDPK